jgi:hypothetical protein
MQVINLKFQIPHMYKFLFIVFICISTSCFSQSTGMVREAYGSVIVNKDPRLDLLAAKQAEINKKAARLNSAGYYPGFRIQVANTQNRDEANSIKAEMLRRFPDQKVYLLYQAPYFRVRVGNFFTQKEGSPLRKMIMKLYPDKGIFFVQDRIEYTPPEGEEATQ